MNPDSPSHLRRPKKLVRRNLPQYILNWSALFWSCVRITSLFVIIFTVIDLTVIHFHNGRSSSSTAMESACNRTLYPELCLSTLLSYPNAERESPKNFAYMTANVTMSQTHEAYRLALKLDPRHGDLYERTSLERCIVMLEDSLSAIKLLLAEGLQPSNGRQIAKLQLWLYEVVKNHDTCSEWLQDFGSARTVPLQKKSRHLSNSITNAMYLLNLSFPLTTQEAETFYVPYQETSKQVFVQSHRRHPQEVAKQGIQERFPEWIKDSGALLKNVNVTVAQDGSGHYKTITEALHNAPSYSREPYVIFVKQGIYNENVNAGLCKEKINVVLIVERKTKTTIAADTLPCATLIGMILSLFFNSIMRITKKKWLQLYALRAID